MTTTSDLVERDELRRTCRALFTARSPLSLARQRLEPTDELRQQLREADARLWSEMVDTIGLAGLAIPERLGGSGYSMVELGVAFEECGRALVATPMFASVALASSYLLEAGSLDAQQRVLPQIAAGSLTATVAATPTSVRYRRTQTGWALDGAAGPVVDGTTADLIIVVADGADGPGLFAVRPGAAGLVVEACAVLDPTRPVAQVRLNETPGEDIGAGDPSAYARADARAAAALVSEMVGAAQRCLDLAAEYAMTRQQFGRPLAAFQAIKHLCADMLLDVESSHAVAERLCEECDGPNEQLLAHAAMAKAYCSDAYHRVAANVIQVLGGIGFTWEHDAHLFYRRAQSAQALLGNGARRRAELASLNAY